MCGQLKNKQTLKEARQRDAASARQQYESKRLQSVVNVFGLVYARDLFLSTTNANIHRLKRVPIRSRISPYSNWIRRISLRIQFECGKIRTRKTPNRYIFYTVIWMNCNYLHLMWNKKMLSLLNKFSQACWKSDSYFMSVLKIVHRSSRSRDKVISMKFLFSL